MWEGDIIYLRAKINRAQVSDDRSGHCIDYIHTAQHRALAELTGQCFLMALSRVFRFQVYILYLYFSFSLYFIYISRLRGEVAIRTAREREIYKEPINFRRVVCAVCVLSFSLFYLVFFQLSTQLYIEQCAGLSFYIQKKVFKSLFFRSIQC